MSKMRVFVNNRDAVPVAGTADRPVCKANEMLMHTMYNAISNGTERNVATGSSYAAPAPKDPYFCNYQLVAVVEECGSEITKYKVGDVLYCAVFPGYAEYFTVTEDDLIIKLPDEMDRKEATYFGAAGVGLHNVARAEVTARDNVLVFGAGLIGLFTAQAAQAFGATVTIVDSNAERLELAAKLGIRNTVNISDDAGKAELKNIAPFDVVFDDSAKVEGKELLEYIVGIGMDGETLMGFHSRLVLTTGRYNVEYNFNAAQVKELRIMHVHHFHQVDLDNLLRMVMQGYIKIRPLITRELPIDEMPAAYKILVDDPKQLMGTVFTW